MIRKANGFLLDYKLADPEERLDIMMSNYAMFPKIINKEERKTIYKIKAEKEFIRSHKKDTLGIRVQTSGLSDPTSDEAIINIDLEDAVDKGKLNQKILDGIDNAIEYESDIAVIKVMKMDYELLSTVIDNLKDSDAKVIKQYLIEGRLMKEIADDEGRSYEAIKKRIERIRVEIHEEIIDCLQMNCRR